MQHLTMFSKFRKKGQPETNSPAPSRTQVEAGGAEGETSTTSDLLATETDDDEAFGLKLVVAGDDPFVELAIYTFVVGFDRLITS